MAAKRKNDSGGSTASETTPRKAALKPGQTRSAITGELFEADGRPASRRDRERDDEPVE